jgi:hypothetical protein
VTRTASLAELVERLNELGQIQSMKATVDLQLSLLSDDEEQVREFRDVRGYVLTRRPSFIRTIALAPVVRSTAFDMASDGETFQVHFASRNRFFEGLNALSTRSEKRGENVRPQHILEAIMIDPPEAGEEPALENAVENLQPFQVVLLVRKNGNGNLRLTRKFWFDRNTLDLSRLQIFDEHGDIVAHATYSEWDQENSLPYPKRMSIARPQDGYTLNIHVLKPGLNEPIPDDSFVLTPPPGVPVERLGAGKEEERPRIAGAGQDHD